MNERINLSRDALTPSLTAGGSRAEELTFGVSFKQVAFNIVLAALLIRVSVWLASLPPFPNVWACLVLLIASIAVLPYFVLLIPTTAYRVKLSDTGITAVALFKKQFIPYDSIKLVKRFGTVRYWFFVNHLLIEYADGILRIPFSIYERHKLDGKEPVLIAKLLQYVPKERVPSDVQYPTQLPNSSMARSIFFLLIGVGGVLQFMIHSQTTALAAILIIAVVGLVLLFVWFTRKSATAQNQGRLVQRTLELRDILYCKDTLDDFLSKVSTDSKLLKQAITYLQKGQYLQAKSELESAQSNVLHNNIFYWFALAKAQLLSGNERGAMEALLQVTKFEESRAQLQAWSFLREQGHMPGPNDNDKVLGVIVEIGMVQEGQAVIVAGYADGQSRMFFTSGGGIIGDMTQFPAVIDAAKKLCVIAQHIVSALPIETTRPLPSLGHVRFYLLTPGGTHIADELESQVQSPNNRLLDTFVAMNQLLTTLRHVQENAKQGKLPHASQF